MLTPGRASPRIGIAVFTAVIVAVHSPDAMAQATDLVTQARQALAADKVDEAIATLEKAIVAAPHDPAALATLGSAQVRKARTAPPMDAPGWVSKGFDTLDEAVKRFPEAFVVHIARGITAASVPEMFGKAPVAVKDLAAVVAMREKNPTAVPDTVMPSVYVNLGIAHRKTGAIAEARAAWEKGKQLYPGWFEGKQALVDWYHSETHQAAMKAVFPGQSFDRTPLPDLAEDSGPILAIVSVRFAGPPRPDAPSPSISSIGIELYGPLPGGVAVGGRFAPAAVKVRGLREIDIRTAQPR